MNNLQFGSYLGDGVYVGFDGFKIWLYTHEGNRIALEPVVFQQLIKYREILERKLLEKRMVENENLGINHEHS